MSISAETITKIYQAYLPEMIEIVIDTYEHYRNLKLPKGHTPYSVNRKRFNDDFWKEVVNEHIKHRYNPKHTIPFGRRMCGGQMPWPDLICKLPGLIAIEDRWQNRLRTAMASDQFTLGHFNSCDTPQKLGAAIELWNNRNPEITPTDDTSIFCIELASRNWQFLLEDPDGRRITAHILLSATEQDGLEQLDKVFGDYLQELSDQL
ncbi:hypothetical protein P4B35_18390 [Pontiellaceae bacterium B12227]|nr:hypothetical protein [Pontiellaceae bacterium B12227]